MTIPNRPLPYADDVEAIPADEADDIQRVVQALEVLLGRSQVKTGQFRADVHVKTHGYAQGEFRVLPNLPNELAQGLFDHARSYPAVVRFSNAASQPQPDAIPDGRGMAIKVLEVADDLVQTDEQRGPAQDFVMINHPVFFARNVKDYLRLEQVLVQTDDNSLATLQGVLTGGDWNPLHWHWREMLTAARIAGQLPAHPASNTYFSMAPIRFGDYVAKYRAKAAGDRLDSYLDLVQRLGSEADALRLALEEMLHTQEVLFEFQVQLRTSAQTMPIEDATVEWPESESPYRTVAHLLLPRQEIAALRQQSAYQNLAFNVWHALAAHRPLGGINRVRRWAYTPSRPPGAVSQPRRSQNSQLRLVHFFSNCKRVVRPAAMSHADPMTEVLANFRRQEATDFGQAWVGMEPTFQSEKSVRKWIKMSAEPGGEDAYFEDDYMLKTQKKVVKKIKKRYEEQREEGQPHCMFARVELDDDLDQWQVRRQNLRFFWEDEGLEPLEVRLSLDPETFEYSIKPVPLAWFYDERFVTFLEEFLWKTPRKLGLSFAIAHGGGQFSLSAKTVMTGSLLADDIAARLNHPELATWIMDWPNPDDRAFRATGRRKAAFQQVLDAYWAGRFHPRAIDALTAENALLDRGFGPACVAPGGLMDSVRGPVGDAREVFQTNFAFGRTVRWSAQNVDPGYWQSAHPDEDGYRPDQIMRYSEGNLNRLQIAGELHVKSGKVLDQEQAPEMDAPLELALLTTEASWENRAQMSRTSARDYVEAQLLYVHSLRRLQQHPHVAVTESLLQDQILGDAEQTLRRHGGTATLDQLRRAARQINLDESRGRLNTDWIEPETLFWASWRALPAGERAAVAREAVGNFVAYVHEAAALDPREAVRQGDPMEWHRHRIHPVLWQALVDAPFQGASDPVNRELAAWQAEQEKYLARRPVWSQLEGARPPWE